MRGFNTKKAQSCKDGGLIRGPGTGTSDSIPRGFKPGTFIMPADSTKAIGPDVLENIAKVPTKVSNGEFAHTPQEVHAVGINALRAMKDATHSPKDEGVYFSNGGTVKGRGAKGFAIGGEVTNDVTRIGNSYSGGNVGGSITVNGAAPRGFTSNLPGVPGAPNAAVQALPGAMPSPGAPTSLSTSPATPVDSLTARNNSVSASSITRTGIAPTATPPALSAMATPPATPPVAKPVDSFTARNNAVSASSITNNGGRFDRNGQQFADGGDVRGFQTPVQRLAGGDAVKSKQELYDDWQSKKAPWYLPTPKGNMEERIAEKAYTAAVRDPSVPVNAAAALSAPAIETAAQNPTDMRLASGTQATPGLSSLAATSVPAAPATQAAQPAPAQPVAQALAQVPSLAPVQAQGFQAPTVRHSGNDWQARNDLRNARVSASSIMNRPEWQGSGMGRFRGGQQQGPSESTMAYQAALAQDAAARGQEIAGQQQAMVQGQSNAREAMQQTGENQRTSLREQGFATRDQRKAGVDERTLAMQEAESGFKTRAQAQLEGLRNTLFDPKATAEQKAQAQAQISALSVGLNAKDRYITVGGGTRVVDGQTVKDPVNVLDTQTRTWVEQPGQGAAQAASPYKDGQELKGKDGKTYVVKNGAPVLK